MKGDPFFHILAVSFLDCGVKFVKVEYTLVLPLPWICTVSVCPAYKSGLADLKLSDLQLMSFWSIKLNSGFTMLNSSFELLRPWTHFLCLGDNILAVLKYLLTSERLADSSEYRHGNMVFFDLLGFVAVAYPARVGTILNYIVATATFLYLAKRASLPGNGGRSPFPVLDVCYVMSLPVLKMCFFLFVACCIDFL